MTTSSGTNCPLSIKLFASSPRGVRLAISSRNKLPVDRWISLYFSTSFSDCVPFPLPGGPNRIKLNISEYKYRTVKIKGRSIASITLLLFLKSSHTAVFFFQEIIVLISFLKKTPESFYTTFLCHIEIIHNR